MSKASKDQGPQARVGAVIKGKWKVESLLGVGGMAAVYAGQHRNGTRAALKILHADFAREKTICERFLREAYVSNKVNHSGTVQVVDDDVTEQGEPFLIMELLEGETVRDAWKKAGRTMPVGRVLQICERVVDCLVSCHAINVIHRDLKPANVFITNDGEIKVLDFGVAQMRDATSERTATGTALGTPAYMSPEQAMGLVDQLDGRADLFSVGAMMHALITGHRINNGRTEQEALVMAATKPVPSVARIAPQLPIDLIKLVDKSLAWDRRNRFSDARDMQRALLDQMPANNVTPLPNRPPPRPNEVLVAPLEHHVVSAPAAPAAPAVPVTAPAPPPAPVAQPAEPAHAAAHQQQLPQGVHVPHMPAPPSIGRPPAAAPPVSAAAPAFDPLFGFAPPQPGVAPAPAPAPQQPPAAPAAPEVPESDPRVQTLRDLMKHFDRILPSARQFGWQHPATERTLKTAYDAWAEALRQQPTIVDFTIRPYSFMTLGHSVWEPGAPYDAIPYNLFACGVRLLRVGAGLGLDELRDLVAILSLDPGRDLPPEDDLAAALWEKNLPHVTWECVDAFAEGDAAEREQFFGEADEIENLAAQAAIENQSAALEARAMALSTDDEALGKKKERSPFALDDAMKQALGAQLSLTRELWATRYVDALVEGYLDAAANRDAALVLASLRKSAADLVVAGRLDVVVQINDAMCTALRTRVQNPDHVTKLVAALTNSLFGGETLELVLRRLQDDDSQVESVRSVFASLSPNELGPVLNTLRTRLGPAARALLLQYVERNIVTRESELVPVMAGADPDAISGLLNLLARSQSPTARQALGQLTQIEDPNVRIEARVLVAQSKEQAQQEVASQLEGPMAIVRMAALRVAVRYRMISAWPTVSRLASAKSFNDLGSDERRELLRALIVLSPDRGEGMALDIAKKGGVLMSEERETTRAAAAELLGEFSRSRQIAQGLSELSQVRWGVSDETRTAAAHAAKRIAERAAQAPGVSP
ncbi:MAG: serine/threonine protein kinase [Myxococcales bacterium]|nr:serine/threonine protein kinase [Myxococcales bacterium]